MSVILTVLKPREVIRILERGGFFIHHQSGSHVQLKHRKKKTLRVTVPYHSKDLPKQVLMSILRQAQISLEEFNALR